MSQSNELAKPTVRLSLESVDARVRAEIQHHAQGLVSAQWSKVIQVPLETLHMRVAELYLILARQVTRGCTLQNELLLSADNHSRAAKEFRELRETDEEGEGA